MSAGLAGQRNTERLEPSSLRTDLMLCLGIPDLLQHVVGSIDNTPGTGPSPAASTNPSDNPNQTTSPACPGAMENCENHFVFGREVGRCQSVPPHTHPLTPGSQPLSFLLERGSLS